jgi:DMSO/TMAO reductase YedYZ molybdopterin-dependent catalytic subunit
MKRKPGVWIRGFGTGAAAGVAATLVLFAYRGATGTPTLPEVLAERMVRLLPYRVFAVILADLQHLAKPLGFTMAVGVILAGFGMGGVLYARLARASRRSRLHLGLAAATVTWVFLAYAFLPVIQGGILGVPLATTISAPALPMAVGSLVYGLLLACLNGPASPILPAGHSPLPSEALSRRALLRRVTPILLAVTAASLGAWAAIAGRRTVSVTSWAFRRLMGMPPQDGGMPPEVTPNGQFYQVSKNYPFDPTVNVAAWTLHVTGLVTTPLTLSYAEFVKAAPAVERYHTLECIANEVGGDLIGNARWKGLRMKDVLNRAGVGAGAATVILRSVDNYAESVPLAVALDPTTLLAYEMNGEPLPQKHGAPVRVLIANRYGMKQPKWLTRIEVVAPDFAGYWEVQGRSAQAIVKIHSAFRVTAQDGAVVRLGGWAFAGTRGISKLEVSADGGKTWIPTALRAALGANCWQFWTAVWTPPAPGEYALQVRAVDGTGVTQPGKRRRLPDGAEGYHEVRIRVSG